MKSMLFLLPSFTMCSLFSSTASRPYDIGERQRQLGIKPGGGQDAAQDAQVVDASWDRGDEGAGGGQLRSCAGVGGASWNGGTWDSLGEEFRSVGYVFFPSRFVLWDSNEL